MRSAKESAAAACIGALVLGSFASDAQAQTPIELSGELEASVVSRQLPSDDEYEFRSQMLGHTHISSYLWRPWIATLSADLDAAFETSTSSEFGEATGLAGDFFLSALPSSRYPFQVFFSASDNRFDGDYSGFDYTRLRAGVSGRAAFSDRVSLDYHFSHDEFDQHKFGDLTAQRAEATLRRSFDAGEMPLNISDIGVSLNYYNTDLKGEWVDDRGFSTESIAGTVFYRAAPTESVDHDFSATMISDRSGNSDNRFNRIMGQGVGTLQWRSPSNDFTATSAVRMLVQEIDHGFGVQKTDTESALMALNAGINWRASDQLSMSLGARATGEHIGTFASTSTTDLYEPTRSNYGGGILGTIDYRSLTQELAGFSWHWDARAVGDLGYDSNRYKRKYYETLNGPHSDASLIIGHTVERPMWLPGLGTMNASFLQEAGFSHYSEDQVFRPIITHSASFSKGFAGENSSSYFRFYLRDTHSFGEGAEEYQTAQVDFTRQMQLTGNRSLHGSVGAQVVRQSRYARDDFYIFAHGELTYEHHDLFDVDGLSFSSDFRINSIGLDDLARDWRDDLTVDLFRNDWRNRLQYRIGQLTLSLEGTLFAVDGRLGHYVGLSGRRSFDNAD